MREGDWRQGLVKGMVTGKETFDRDDEKRKPIKDAWANCIVFTEEIRWWVFERFQECDPIRG